jgi:histidine triad (HIT) family protein
MSEPVVTADPDCLFCRIVAGEIPADVVREDDRTLAFRDIDPKAPTHVLVIPKAHHRDLVALGGAPDDAAAVLAAAAAVAEDEALGDFRAVANTGAGAGQTVFHAHLHLLAGRPLTWPPG